MIDFATSNYIFITNLLPDKFFTELSSIFNEVLVNCMFINKMELPLQAAPLMLGLFYILW